MIGYDKKELFIMLKASKDDLLILRRFKANTIQNRGLINLIAKKIALVIESNNLLIEDRLDSLEDRIENIESKLENDE